jgi:myo-inositol-1(or 4)-monophosphatase
MPVPAKKQKNPKVEEKKMDYSKYLNTAVFAAKAGGEILSKYYKSNLKVEFKGIRDPVSEADKNSQKKIISILKKAYPSHGFLAEEDSMKDIENKEFYWIIDPLDGTVNFVHTLPIFCVSIALCHKNEIIAGAIYAPILNELFTAQKGRGAFLNGKKIKVSKTDKLIKCLAVTGFPYNLDKRSKRIMKHLQKVLPQVQAVRRLGSAALDAAYTACGRLDFYWEDGAKPWDIAAGAIIVKEAGGRVSDYKDGGNYFKDGEGFLCSNSLMHKEVVKILNEK